MGEETLAGEVSAYEAADPAVETKSLKSGVSLMDKTEIESNGVKDLQDDGKDLLDEKIGSGKEVKGDEDRKNGRGEEKPRAEAMDVEAIKGENGEGAVREKEFEEKAEKDVDVNRVKDEKDAEGEEKTEETVEKSGKEKIEQQLGEGSKVEDIAEEVERSKEEKNAQEGEESKEVMSMNELKDTKEVKGPDELEESKGEKTADEAEESQEEEKEEEHDEGKLQNSKDGKPSKKRSRRKSYWVRRDRRKKERKEVEKEEAAKGQETTDAKKNKKKEEKKEKDEKEIDWTPILVGRPVRERKSVERLVSIIEKDAHKEFKIEKWHSKLRRKNDDTLKLLHNLLFGQRCKAFEIRGHISRFSGFVWHDDEEKKKNKAKEKFDKCTKEKLLEICDVLDIPVSRASNKKEELVTSLIDFLVAPYATTTVVLAKKESSKGQKRKRAVSSARRSGKKKSEDSSKGKGNKPQSDSGNDSEKEEEEEPENEVETENGIPETSVAEMPDQSESEEKDVSEESRDETRKRKSKNAKSTEKKDMAGKAKSKKAVTLEKPKKPSSRRLKVEDGDRRVSSKKNEKGIKKSPTPTKSAGRQDAKGKGKSKDATTKPNDEELISAICEILKEVDLNTATFTDILKLLAKQFDMDLTSRKSSIKLMIQEELTKLADEADDDEEDDEAEPEKEEGNTRKDEAVAGGTEVKA